MGIVPHCWGCRSAVLSLADEGWGLAPLELFQFETSNTESGLQPCVWKPQAAAQEWGQAQFLEALVEFGFVLWHLPSFLGLFLCFSLFSASTPFSLHQVLTGQTRGWFTPCEVHSECNVQQHRLCYQHPAGTLVCSFSPCFCSLLPDLSSLTIPYDEEDEEDPYNDVDSSDSMNTTSHNTTLNQDEPNVEMEEDDIYEVLPGEQPNKQVKTQAIP